MPPRTQRQTGHEPTSVNQVHLAGRLAAPPETRQLPSGDQVVTFRLVVSRGRGRRASKAGRAGVDTIDCTIWTAGLRRRSASWTPGEKLAVEGSLRRHFWRSAGGPRSRYDVEVTAVTRVAAAVPSAGDRSRP